MKLIPTRMSSMAMMRVAMYSARPCPWGCSLSGCFLAILNPKMTTPEVEMSEKEWKPSAMRAMLLM